MLFLCKISSTVLPLFSNIPVTPIQNLRKDDKVWNFVFFGTLSPSWRFYEFFCRVDLARLEYCIDLCHFNLIGNCGEFADSLWGFNKKVSTLVLDLLAMAIFLHQKYPDFYNLQALVFLLCRTIL